MGDSHTRETPTVYELTKKSTYILTLYFIAILIIGIIISIRIITTLTTIQQPQVMLTTIIASISIAGITSSVQYLKRIYKACISNRIIEPQSTQTNTQYGYMLYFFLRPVFSFAFVLIAIFSILSGLLIITASIDYSINERFLYFCVVISSFIGFSTGRILDRFEEMSNHKVDNMFKQGKE